MSGPRPPRASNWRNLARIERLIAEFEAGRFDSPLVRQGLGGGAFPRLLRACYLAESGQLARARADVDAASSRSGQNPVARLIAGSLCFVTRDYQRALDHFAAAGSRGGEAQRRGRQMAISAAITLGWDHDARELIERAIAEDPEHESWRVQAVRLYVRGGWHDRALAHAHAALERTPTNASLRIEAAGLHARLGQRTRALAELRAGLEHAPDERRLDYLREAGRVAIDAGDFELATRCFEQALTLEPKQPEVVVWLAELAAWAGDIDQARAHAERALTLEPDHGPALRLLGSVAVLERRFNQAIELLERALHSTPKDYQAHLWLGEAALETGDYERAHAELDAGIAGSGEPLLAGSLLRYLAVARHDPEAPNVVPNQVIHEFGEGLAELVDEAGTALTDGRASVVIPVLEAGLRALVGNRSNQPTCIRDGSLHRLDAGTGCRFASRQALQLLRVAPPSECHTRLSALVEHYPGSSLPLCHRGELHLWVGDLDTARGDLEAAVAMVIGTRWAYMGLSTLDLLAGDPQACLATNARGVEVMSNTEGPAIYVFRGEALRKLGRRTEARIELERSVAAHPARASATINLVLLRLETDELDGARELWRRLVVEQASGLISDAASERGVALADDPDADVAEVMKAVLERALEMMGGNRSSSLLTYRTASGQLRFVQQWPHGLASPHARDELRLARARSMIVRALAAARN